MRFFKYHLMSISPIVFGIIACSSDGKVAVRGEAKNRSVASEAADKAKQGVAAKDLVTTVSSAQCSVGEDATKNTATTAATFTAQIGIDDSTPVKYTTLHIKVDAVSKQGTVINLFDNDIPRNNMTSINANIDVPLAQNFSIITKVTVGNLNIGGSFCYGRHQGVGDALRIEPKLRDRTSIFEEVARPPTIA